MKLASSPTQSLSHGSLAGCLPKELTPQQRADLEELEKRGLKLPHPTKKLSDIFPPQPDKDDPTKPGPQQLYIECKANIVGYGGSAGGGKTFGTLLKAAQHVHVPGFEAVIFRRTMKQVKDAGGPWVESTNLYPLIGGDPNVSSAFWKFPSGAKIRFAGLEHEKDKYDWQSSQICHLYFEEGTHFTEPQFWYMLSRNRSTCGVEPQVGVTMNPMPGFMKRLFAPWVDKKFPNPAQSGEVRWFKRQNNQILWLDEPPVQEPCGCLKEGCSKCFSEIYSITFIRASVFDNRKLLEKDPGYLARLSVQDEVEKRRLLYGDWDAKPANLVLDAFDEHSSVFRADVLGPTPTHVGLDFGDVNFAGVIVKEELEQDGFDPSGEKKWKPTGRLIVTAEDWPGHTRSFEDSGNTIRKMAGRPLTRGAGGNKSTEQGWRQSFRKEGIPMEEPDKRHTDPALQYKCVNDEFRNGTLLIHESCVKLIDMIGNFQRELDDEGNPTDKFDDTKFHLLAALRYIIVKLRPPKVQWVVDVL
jgi:hypothetical protein